MQQQIPFRRSQFSKADLQVLPTNLLILLSTGLFRQLIPNLVDKDQRASSHSTSIFQGLKPSDREQPTTKRRALFKIIEFAPRNQARFLGDLFDIMPCRQQSAQKRTDTRLVLHHKAYKNFVSFVVVHWDSFFGRLIIQNKRILPQVENLDRKTFPPPIRQPWTSPGAPRRAPKPTYGERLQRRPTDRCAWKCDKTASDVKLRRFLYFVREIV